MTYSLAMDTSKFYVLVLSKMEREREREKEREREREREGGGVVVSAGELALSAPDTPTPGCAKWWDSAHNLDNIKPCSGYLRSTLQ